MAADCELKRIYLWISSKNDGLNVDKAAKELSAELKGLEVRLCADAKELTVVFETEASQSFLILGDGDIKTEDGMEKPVDIGVGKAYRGGAPFVIYDLLDIDQQYIRLVWARKNKRPLVIAETKRLLIREFAMEDLDSLYELYGTLMDCSYVEQLYDREEEAEFERKYIENMYGFFGYGLWLVFLKDTGKLVARVGIENREIDGETVQELGYLVDKRYQNNHIALESCRAVLDYGKNQLYLKQIFTCIHKENKKSIALAGKLGFNAYAMDIDNINIYKKVF